MILPIAFLIGALVGWVRASKRAGNRLDKLQFAAAHGIAVTLVTFIALVILNGQGLI